MCLVFAVVLSHKLLLRLVTTTKPRHTLPGALHFRLQLFIAEHTLGRSEVAAATILLVDSAALVRLDVIGVRTAPRLALLPRLDAAVVAAVHALHTQAEALVRLRLAPHAAPVLPADQPLAVPVVGGERVAPEVGGCAFTTQSNRTAQFAKLFRFTVLHGECTATSPPKNNSPFSSQQSGNAKPDQVKPVIYTHTVPAK